MLPWLVARLVAVPALVLAGDPGSVQPNRLIWMDGLWFRMIALDWYDRPYVAGQWSEYPFFPLFPALGGGLMRLGIGATTALTAVSWVASLVALSGAYRLASRHLPARAAVWAPWFIALAPGALGFVMGYADSLFLAGSVGVAARRASTLVVGRSGGRRRDLEPSERLHRRRRTRRHGAGRSSRSSRGRRRRAAVDDLPRRLVQLPLVGDRRSPRVLVGKRGLG